MQVLRVLPRVLGDEVEGLRGCTPLDPDFGILASTVNLQYCKSSSWRYD